MAPLGVVPYDRNGNLLRDTSGPFVVHEWRENVPFRVPLTLRRRVSASYVIWTDTYGHEFPMAFVDLMDLLHDSTISRGAVVGTWVVAKRGRSYGIRHCEVDI